MTDDEREHLARFSVPGIGLLVWLINLILVPTIGGGSVGFVLTAFGFNDSGAYQFGLALGLAGGVLRLWSDIRGNREFWAPYAAAKRAALADALVDQVSFQPQFAWEVDGVGDFGPAYLFDTGEDEAVFMCSQELPYPENGNVSVGQISAEVVPHTDELINLVVGSGATPCREDACDVNTLKVSFMSGLKRLPRSILPPSTHSVSTP